MNLIRFALPFVFLAVQCFANPASNNPFTLKQPDGSTVQAREVGDEWFSFIETADGYILQKDRLGFYAYADENGESSGIYARDAQNRSPEDVLFINGLDQDAIYKKMRNRASDVKGPEYVMPKLVSPGVQRLPAQNKRTTQGEVRVLVVLVQFSDVKFKSSNPKAQFTDFLNKEGYNEYHHKGSLRDYFINSSKGLFRPTFDVYAPVTVSGSQADYGVRPSGDRNLDGAMHALSEALDILMSRNEVDFSLYDNDGDGGIEYLCMIFAGSGYHSVNSPNAIWPHMNYLEGKRVGNGKTVDKYACANEIGTAAYSDDASTTTLEGIGILAHEMSHVLGLPDLYDPYGRNKRNTPDRWDVMDQGLYNCPRNDDHVYSCAPALYSAFERMSLGWATPVELNTSGLTRLNKTENNVAYQISNERNSNEFYLLEYRSRNGWDSELPNSGMLVWHIDYDPGTWYTYVVNSVESHMRVDIIEAVPEENRNNMLVSAYAMDPFPGTGDVTEFNRFIFWSGADKNIALLDIKESDDYEYVTFDVCMDAKSCPLTMVSSSSGSSSSKNISSSSRNVNLVERCVEFKGNDGNVGDFCYKSGLKNMEEGICYVLNPNHPRSFLFNYLSTDAADGSWWFETPCYEEVPIIIVESSSSIVEIESSSSDEESSSFEESSSSSTEESSSSEIVLSSSEEVSSSSSIELSSSSSEPEWSSSSDAESSSSEEPSSSSEESSSSSEEESSSSEMQISSSEEYSSSSETASSSSEESSSSDVPESSSSEQSLSSSEVDSSSSDAESSSSEDVESSSSEGLVGVSSKILAQGIRVNAKNGAIYVYAPQQGRKVVRIFSLIGSLLLERAMDGSELVVNDKILGKMGLILSVSQGNRALFTGMINAR